MIPLTIKPVSQQSQPDNSKISIDIAEQIADRAARRAADETATRLSQENRENMESFNRFQEQNKHVNEVKEETSDRSAEDDPGVDLFDKTTATSISKTMRAVKAMQEFLAPPPDPIRAAMENGISQMAAKFVENTLLGGGGAGVVVKKPSFLMDVLNTAAAHGFGEQLGANLPNVIQSLTGAIGQQKTQELASAATRAMGGQTGTVESGSPNSDQSNAEKQKDMVLALDVNNPDHVKQYASAMGLSEKAAKGMLQIHQDDILTDRKDSSGTNANVGNSEISQALSIIIQEMTGMKQTINNLQSELVSIKGKKPEVDEDVETPQFDDKWSDDDRPPQIEVTKSPLGAPQKSVTLFSTPIQVNVDDIKGDTNSFFNDKPAPLRVSKLEKEEESVLEEIVDSEGKSTFKMSDEKEQPKNVTENKVEKDIEKKIEKSIDKPIEKEEDKKKENSVESDELDELVESYKSDESDELEKDEPESIEELPQTKEILQSEEKPHRRRLIRKPIPVREDLPSHVTEHYDIDNKLIP